MPDQRTMFQQWLQKLQSGSDSAEKPDAFWIERLTAVLLVEVARADTTIDQAETEAIRQAIVNSSKTIGAEEVEEIIATATVDAESTISFHDHVREINSDFGRERKHKLIEQIGRVAYADGDLDKYEEYTIRKMADLLFIEHEEFIKAKLRVLGSV